MPQTSTPTNLLLQKNNKIVDSWHAKCVKRINSIPKFSSLTHPYLLLTIPAFIWASNTIAGKLAVDHVSPFLATWLRWGLASIILWLIAWPKIKNDWPVIKNNLPYLIILGALGFCVFNNLMYLALTFTSAINAALEQASMPLMVFVLNYLLFRTKTNSFQIIGFILTLIGIVVIVTRGNPFSTKISDLNIGDVIMIIAIMIYGIYSVLLRKKPQIHVLSFMSILALSSFFFSSFFLVYEIATNTIILPDAQGWGVVIYAALLPSIVSQPLWIMGLEKVGSNRGGLFINLVPVFGAILAIFILGEQFLPYHMLGACLVLGGIMLAQKSRKLSS